MKNDGIMLSWENLTLSVYNKCIIVNESGSIKQNSLVALLGTSGAGKTSFLNALAGRVPSTIMIKGKILLNKREREYKSWMKNIAYVEQNFYAYIQQTVYETLYFSVFLRNNHGDIKANVNYTMKVLGLYTIKDTRLAHISGGELKRVAIGTELVCNPKLIFLDEPTSGLDSFNALKLVETLKELADHKTILMTVHQPSFVMSKLFNEIMIMAQGNCVFQGNIEGCIRFFTASGFSIPENTNPCDYFMDTIALNTTDDESISESLHRIDKIKYEWSKNKNYYKEDDKRDYGEFEFLSGNEELSLSEKISKYALIPTFMILFRRNLMEFARDTRFLKIQLFQKITFLLLLGLVFLQLGYSMESVQSRTGVIFFLLINGLFGTAGPILNVFPLEKRIISRERKTGFYDGCTAYMSKFLSTIIFELVYSFIYVTAIYWMVGLNPNAGRFFIFMIIIESGILFAVSLGLTVGTYSPTEKFSQVLGTTLLIIFIIFGGSFSNPNTIPSWLRWFLWVSPVNYAFRALMINQYQGLVFGDLTGEEILITYGVDSPGVWANIFGLWGLTAACILIGAVGLHFLTAIKLKLKE